MPDFSQIELRSAIYRNYLYRAIWLKYTCYDTGPRFTALSHPEDHYLYSRLLQQAMGFNLFQHGSPRVSLHENIH